MDNLRSVFELLPHGLYLVGAQADGRQFVYTASWLTQASFEPPLLVTAVRRSHPGHAMLEGAGRFTVNFIGRGQLDLARVGFAHTEDRLAEVAWRPCVITGAPVILDGLGYAGCEVVQWVEGGDHDLVVARVVVAERFREGELLTIHDTPWSYH